MKKNGIELYTYIVPTSNIWFWYYSIIIKYLIIILKVNSYLIITIIIKIELSGLPSEGYLVPLCNILQLPMHLKFPMQYLCNFLWIKKKLKKTFLIVQIPADLHLLLTFPSLQDSGPFGLLVIQMQKGTADHSVSMAPRGHVIWRGLWFNLCKKELCYLNYFPPQRRKMLRAAD